MSDIASRLYAATRNPCRLGIDSSSMGDPYNARRPTAFPTRSVHEPLFHQSDVGTRALSHALHHERRRLVTPRPTSSANSIFGAMTERTARSRRLLRTTFVATAGDHSKRRRCRRLLSGGPYHDDSFRGLHRVLSDLLDHARARCCWCCSLGIVSRGNGWFTPSTSRSSPCWRGSSSRAGSSFTAAAR